MNGTNVHNIIYYTEAFIPTHLELTDGTALTIGHATTAPRVEQCKNIMYRSHHGLISVDQWRYLMARQTDRQLPGSARLLGPWTMAKRTSILAFHL